MEAHSSDKQARLSRIQGRRSSPEHPCEVCEDEDVSIANIVRQRFVHDLGEDHWRSSRGSLRKGNLGVFASPSPSPYPQSSSCLFLSSSSSRRLDIMSDLTIGERYRGHLGVLTPLLLFYSLWWRSYEIH